MTLLLSGTDGLSDVDGTAATPAIRGTDANTGMFFPAADTIAFSEGGVEAMRLDSAGNMGIGTGSPTEKLTVAGNILTSAVYKTNRSNTGAVTSGSSLELQIDGTTYAAIRQPSAETLAFYRGGGGTTEAARIDSSGNLLVGTTSSSSHALVKNNSSFYSTQIINNSATNPYALQLLYSGVTGGAGQAFLVCTDNANRLLIAGNGNVTNVNGSYGAISDAKLKENVTDATPKLEKLNQVRIVNFNMIGDTQKQIGVIAQELEQVFPGMVEESPDRDKDGNDLGATTKSVKYSVFVPMLIKAMQEQQKIIESLTARVAQLEAK